MKVGYACIPLTVPYKTTRSFMIKNFSEDRLYKCASENIEDLKNILQCNVKNGIYLFRISSDIIPFGSHKINNIKWWEIFKKQLSEIGQYIKEQGVRVSMHPGQYTVLNSPSSEVLDNSLRDIEYHCKFLDSLKLDYTHKIVLHIGGVYGDKKLSIKRFVDNFQKLSPSAKKRLILENDDKSYNIEEVLEICNKLNIPAVFDNLHHRLNPPVNCEDAKERKRRYNQCTYHDTYLNQSDIKDTNGEGLKNYPDSKNTGKCSGNDKSAIEIKCDINNNTYVSGFSDVYIDDIFKRIKATWKEEDGAMKIHYSDKDTDKKGGSHSKFVLTENFLNYYKKIEKYQPDIMLEVKDKDISAIKCVNLIFNEGKRGVLYDEWARYKYLVMEKAYALYKKCSSLVRENCSLKEFYSFVDACLSMPYNEKNFKNTAFHIWGYFKDCATDKEKRDFLNLMDEYKDPQKVKEKLYKLAVKYEREYLVESYYFAY